MSQTLKAFAKTAPVQDPGWQEVFDYRFSSSRTSSGDIKIKYEINRLLYTYPRLPTLSLSGTIAQPQPTLDHEVAKAWRDYDNCQTNQDLDALIYEWLIPRIP